MDDLTTDTFFNGRIRVMQHRCGYRFSIDAVLAAHYAVPRNDDVVLDLGTGCGIIPLILAYKYPNIRIYGIEIQESLAELALLNVKENNLEDRIVIFCKDMKALKPSMLPCPVNLIVCNPPYRKPESGRINPNQERAVARHEIKAALSDVLDTARRMLQISGRFITIYPAERMAEMLTQMQAAAIEPKRLCMIHSGRHTEAKLVLAEGIRGARQGLKISPPLIIYDEDGTYTKDVRGMFEVGSH